MATLRELKVQVGDAVEGAGRQQFKILLVSPEKIEGVSLTGDWPGSSFNLSGHSNWSFVSKRKSLQEMIAEVL